MKPSMEVFDGLSFNMIQYLESLGISSVELEDRGGCEATEVGAWEASNAPYTLPEDFVAFLRECDGAALSWKAELAGKPCPVAEVRLSRLADVAKVPLDLEENDPGVFDGDEDEPPVCAAVCFESYPRFGRVALLYRGTSTAGLPPNLAPNPQVWFQDLACRWHYLAPDFTSYFRLLVVHLGITGWQYAYTDIGLDPITRQWMSLYCPERLASDDSMAAEKQRRSTGGW